MLFSSTKSAALPLFIGQGKSKEDDRRKTEGKKITQIDTVLWDKKRVVTEQ